jgi:hypothetical protein
VELFSLELFFKGKVGGPRSGAGEKERKRVCNGFGLGRFLGQNEKEKEWAAAICFQIWFKDWILNQRVLNIFKPNFELDSK